MKQCPSTGRKGPEEEVVREGQKLKSRPTHPGVSPAVAQSDGMLRLQPDETESQLVRERNVRNMEREGGYPNSLMMLRRL
jgi:hypothetical protein